MRDHSRKVTEISEITGVENGEIVMNPLYVFEESEESTVEKLCGGLRRTENRLVSDTKLTRSGIYTEV